MVLDEVIVGRDPGYTGSLPYTVTGYGSVCTARLQDVILYNVFACVFLSLGVCMHVYTLNARVYTREGSRASKSEYFEANSQ